MSYVQRILDGLKASAGREVFVHGERRLTGEEAYRTISSMAAVLSDAGLAPGDGVMCLHGNGIDPVLVRVALQAIGCRYLGLRPYATAEKVKHLRDADAVAFVFDPAYADEAAELTREIAVPRVYSLGPAEFGVNLLEAAATRPAVPPVVCRDRADDVAVVAFTSGTTGRPKGVAHTFAAMSACLDAAQHMYGPPPWRFLVGIPLSDLGGELAQWTLASGGTVVLTHEDFVPDEILAAVQRERVTHIFGAPVHIYWLVDHPAVAQTDVSSVRRVIYGGAPSTPARTAEVVERFGCVLMQNYGSQETGYVAALSEEDHRRPELLGSAGRPLPGVEIVVRDVDGAELPRGSVGEVHVRSPMNAVGYWRDPELSAGIFRDGWVRTGDLGRLDDEGYLYLVDRARDIVIVEGYNIYSQRVEQVLTSHPAVRQAIVVGVPDREFGEAVCAAVVTDSGASVDADDLRALVRDTLSPLHVPRHLEFIEQVPTTPRGKPDKVVVRSRFRDLQTA